MSNFSLWQGRSQESGGADGPRLRLVLAHDRSEASTELLNKIRDDIIAVISEHVDLDTGSMHVRLSEEKGSVCLEAYVPLIGHHCASGECQPARAGPRDTESQDGQIKVEGL